MRSENMMWDRVANEPPTRVENERTQYGISEGERASQVWIKRPTVVAIMGTANEPLSGGPGKTWLGDSAVGLWWITPGSLL